MALNALRELLLKTVDFDHLRQHCPFKLFIGTTQANTGRLRVFREFELTVDVLLVLLSPLERDHTPHTSAEIRERITELGFHAHFMREMQLFARAMSFAEPSLVGRGRLERKLQAMRFHMIEPGHCPSMQRPETRLLAHMPYLQFLQDKGRERTAGWLKHHGAAVGVHSTVNVEECFG
jgi:NTE family protein